jgi:hypothetical protein
MKQNSSLPKRQAELVSTIYIGLGIDQFENVFLIHI